MNGGIGSSLKPRLSGGDSTHPTKTKSKSKKWVYPDSVLLLETAFKDAKTESEQIGTAGYVEQVELRFNKNK